MHSLEFLCSMYFETCFVKDRADKSLTVAQSSRYPHMSILELQFEIFIANNDFWKLDQNNLNLNSLYLQDQSWLVL